MSCERELNLLTDSPAVRTRGEYNASAAGSPAEQLGVQVIRESLVQVGTVQMSLCRDVFKMIFRILRILLAASNISFEQGQLPLLISVMSQRNEVEFKTLDGLILRGVLYSASSQGPGIVLAPGVRLFESQSFRVLTLQ